MNNTISTLESSRKTLCFMAFLIVLFMGAAPRANAQVPAMENPCDQITVSYDGYDYTANLFGSVCWFTQNMRNLHYADGSDILNVRAYNDDEAFVPEFGRLYTWADATRLPAGIPTTDSVQGLCPDGWFIPRAIDFQLLANRVGGADAMKSADPSYWLGYGPGLSPASGFNGQPGGLYKAENERYENMLGEGYFWSSTSASVIPLACSLQYGCPQALISEYDAGNGFSVRCVKYYYPPVLAQDLTLTNPTFSSVDATVSLTASGSQMPVVKFYVYTNPGASGTPVAESDYVEAVMTATDTTYSATLTPLATGTTYYVKAVAYNFFGESESNIATSTTLKLQLVSDHPDTFSSCSDTVRYTASVTGSYEAVDMQYIWTSNPIVGVASATGDELAVSFEATTSDTVLCKASYRGTYDSVRLVTDATITTTPVVKDTAITVGSRMAFTFVPDPNADGNIIPNTTTYTWSAPTSATVMGMMAGTDKRKITQTLVNNEVDEQVVAYTVTPSNTAACPGEPFEIAVTVIPMRSFCGISSVDNLGANERGSINHLDSVSDYDGNWYKVLQIGSQCWLKQNLRSSHAANGNAISYSVPNGGVDVELYGYLYNRSSMMNGENYSTTVPSGVQGICPDGWHIPSRAEWEIMLTALDNDAENNCGGVATQNTKALAADCCWKPSSAVCAPGNDVLTNNHSGFSAVPAGHYFGGSFKELNEWAHFWTCTQGSDGGNSDRNYVYNILKDHVVASKETWLSSGYANFDTYYGYSSTSVSVRCVRDEETILGGFPCPGQPTVTDIDGNVYNTVLIGEQCWMRENLKTTRYADGTNLALGTTNSSSKPFRYNPDNNPANVETYGYLYNWFAVMNGEGSSNTVPSGVQGICPDGWHVPSDAEWTRLLNYVSNHPAFVCSGNTAYIAKSLADITGWNSGTNNCVVGNDQSKNNVSGFGARPAGYHETSTNFGRNAYFWSSTEASSNRVYYRSLNYYVATIHEQSYEKKYSLSVRCISNADMPDAEPPAVTTGSLTNISSTSAVCGGEVSSDGGASVSARGVCWATTANPTVSGDHTTDGFGLGTFSSSITGLTPGTIYYVRAYATNSESTSYGNEVSFTTLNIPADGQPCLGMTTVSDYDGNTYNTVKIGNQCWLRENMKTTHYSDGTLIPLGNTPSTSESYCYNPDNNAGNVSIYGYLYNWKAIMRDNVTSDANPSGVQGICPKGWHVPSEAEWTQLENYVKSQNAYTCDGNSASIAKALAATTEWGSSSDQCHPGDQSVYTNNATGFSVLPAGYYNNVGYYVEKEKAALFASATELDSYGIYNRGISYNSDGVFSDYRSKDYGYSVRCLYDEASAIGGLPCPGTPTVSDVDGNIYNTVKIGDQCWMRENLRTTRYANAEEIPLGTNSSATVAYRFNPNNDANNVPSYGYLYNWSAVMHGENSGNGVPSNVQGICPDGWHVPSNAEWTVLTDYVSGQSAYLCSGNSNNIAKSLASTAGWNTGSNTCAVGNNAADNNATGFSALPAGCRTSPYDFGNTAYFWSCTESSADNVYYRSINYYLAVVHTYNYTKNYSLSVRCLLN